MPNNSERNINSMKIQRNVALALIFILISVGTIFFKYLEHWSWIDSFYYIVATSATVGYGDITPKSEIGRLCASIFILLIVPIILYSFTIIAEIYFQNRVKDRTDVEQKITKIE